jgi:hypothetical protein
MSTSKTWIIVGIGGLAALRPGLRPVAIPVIVALVSLVTVTGVMGKDMDSFTVYRYVTPVLLAGLVFFASAILVAVADLTSASDVAWRRALPALLLCAGLALWLVTRTSLQFNDLRISTTNASLIGQGALRSARHAADAWNSGLVVRQWPGRATFAEAQARLPPDARVVSATDTPFLFRFDRQVIHTLDLPGLASPPPGMPSFEGPEALAVYLRGLRYTHLAFTPPLAASGLYSRSDWLALDERGGIRWLLNWAPNVLMFMQNEERLRESYPVLYQSPTLVIIDLRQSTAGRNPAPQEAQE